MPITGTKCKTCEPKYGKCSLKRSIDNDESAPLYAGVLLRTGIYESAITASDARKGMR